MPKNPEKMSIYHVKYNKKMILMQRKCHYSFTDCHFNSVASYICNDAVAMTCIHKSRPAWVPSKKVMVITTTVLSLKRNSNTLNLLKFLQIALFNQLSVQKERNS